MIECSWHDNHGSQFMFIPQNSDDYIFEKIAYGRDDDVAMAVETGKIAPDLRRSDGVPLLNMAVMQDGHQLVRAIIRKDGNLDVVDADQATSLHIACIKGYKGIAKILLDAGANPDLGDKDDVRCLHLLANSSNPNSFMMMRDFLIAGAKPNLADKKGDFPLHDAIRNEDWFKTKLLIHAGADVCEVSSALTPAFHMIELSRKLEDLADLAGDSSVYFNAERMLDKSLTQWRNERVKHPDFPFPRMGP